MRTYSKRNVANALRQAAAVFGSPIAYDAIAAINQAAGQDEGLYVVAGNTFAKSVGLTERFRMGTWSTNSPVRAVKKALRQCAASLEHGEQLVYGDGYGL